MPVAIFSHALILNKSPHLWIALPKEQLDRIDLEKFTSLDFYETFKGISKISFLFYNFKMRLMKRDL